MQASKSSQGVESSSGGSTGTLGGIQGHLFAITGAASGIGRATAQLLVASGAKVTLADKDEGAVMSFASELGENAVGCKVDVTKRDEVDEWLARAASQWGMDCIDGK